MTDIVYIVKDSDLRNNETLKYSLRSVEKYGRNVGRIYIVSNGIMPQWINCDVVKQVHDADQYGYSKDANILHKMLGVDGLNYYSYVCMFDDYFWLKEFDADNIPNWHCGTRLHGNAVHMDAMMETFGALADKTPGVLARNYDIHAPVRINAETFLHVFSRVKVSSFNYCVKTFFFNQDPNVVPVELHDCKIRDLVITPEMYEGWPCLSSPSPLSPSWREWLKNTFPDASRWEKQISKAASPPMRESCVQCACKHIAQARALMLECAKGYEHKLFALGHLAEAEDELAKDHPDLCKWVRQYRLKLENDDHYEFPWKEVILHVAQVGDLETTAIVEQIEAAYQNLTPEQLRSEMSSWWQTSKA